MLLAIKLVTVVCLFAVARRACADDESYGAEWLLFVDERGDTREMNFSTLPAEGRSWRYGSVYFYLYTRILLGLTRWCSASGMFAEARTDGFLAIMREKIASHMDRVRKSPNSILKMIAGRKNALDPEFLLVPENETQMESNYFNSSNHLKVLTHGWLSSGNTQWLLTMKDTYLERYDLNVIVVDWSELAQNPVYPWSACCTRYVGKRLAKLLTSLVQSHNAQGRQMHLIGHSLGAQVMGYAGMFFGDQLHRITGLDPARPLFEIPPMDDGFRLDRSDAEFVDIIHTCAGIYGYEHSHGQADYYPNGGKPRQPGCEGPREAIESCSHGRAYEYFTESIESGQNFNSYPCKSYEDYENGNCKDNSRLMGDPASEDSLGNYYLRTRNESKYAEEDDD